MAPTISPNFTRNSSSVNINVKDDPSRFQLNANSFVKKLGLKFLSKPRFQTRTKAKSRRGSLAEGVNNNPYLLSGPGSRATRSMDILRKPQPFGSMLAVNTAAYLDVVGDADAVRHSMDDSGRSSSSREWKVSPSNDANNNGSVAQGLAVAALVASAEAGVRVAPAQRIPAPNGRLPHTGNGAQLERPGGARAPSDHANTHSQTRDLLPTSTSGVDNIRRPGSSTNINRIQTGGLEQGAGQQTLEVDAPEANSKTVQSESHKPHSIGLAPNPFGAHSQQLRQGFSSSPSSSSLPPSSASSAARPLLQHASDSHKSLLVAAGLDDSTMETTTMRASPLPSLSKATENNAAPRHSLLTTPARAPAPRLNALPSLPPLTTSFSPVKVVSESPTMSSPPYSSLTQSDQTPTSSNAMSQARKQKAAALALSGGVRLSPSVIVRAPPFPILSLPPTTPTAETPRAGMGPRSFRSASMSSGIPSSSSSMGSLGGLGSSSEGRREGRRTAARLNSMPLLPMEGQSNEDDGDDDADHMLEDDMIGEEDEDGEGDPRMSSDSAGVGSASDDEDGSVEDEGLGAPPSNTSAKNPYRAQAFLPIPKRDISFSALLGLDAKGKSREAFPQPYGIGPGHGLVSTPKASAATKRVKEKERGDYFSLARSAAPPSIASSNTSAAASSSSSNDQKRHDLRSREQIRDREGEFEKEVDSALKTPTAADYRLSDATSPRWPPAADYSGTAMWRELQTSGPPGGVGQSSMANGSGKRPGFYHQVSKSMVDLIHLSRPMEETQNAASASKPPFRAALNSADPASSDVRSSRVHVGYENRAPTDATCELSRNDGNTLGPGNNLGNPAKEASKTLPGSGTQSRDGVAISATSTSGISTSANAAPPEQQDAKEPSQESELLAAPALLLSPTSITTTATNAGTAKGVPTLRRQSSMPMFTASGPPPPYPSFLLASSPDGTYHHHPHMRFGLTQPREEEGREMLPKYSNDIRLSGIMPRKMEFSAPGVPARDRKWRRVHIVLEGTAFRVYRVPHTVAGVNAVTGWWESKVGVGDIAQGNGISASSDTRGIVIGNPGPREPRKRSKWEEEMEVRAQEDAHAQQGRASVTIERASMDSQRSSSGSHLPQQGKSKRQLANLLHPNRSRLAVNIAARSQPTSPAASPSTTPRSSFQMARPSTDLSASGSNSTMASASSISNVSSNSFYGNISSSSSTLLSSSNSALSSSTQTASSSSQTSNSNSRSHFRIHRRNDSLNGSSKDGSDSASREKEKESSAVPEPNPKDLLCVYSLQRAESGLASDYFKRKNVLRVRMEGEQFLLQARDVPEVVEWIEGLQAAANIALDLDERQMPKGPIYPRRRRRRRAQRTDASTNPSTTQNSTS